MKHRLTKELLILLACALPVLVQYAVMQSDDDGAWQFFAEVIGLYAGVTLVRILRKWAQRPTPRKADPVKGRQHLRVEIEIRGEN